MPGRKATTKRRAAQAGTRDHPEVIVDFLFDHGLFHVAVVNVSDFAAYQVAVHFDPPFRGLGGESEVSALPLFRCIEFLAPRKRIETFLDSSDAYFQRGEPTRICADVSYSDVRKRVYTRRIVHDLGIYEDVSYLLPGTAANEPAIRVPASPSITPVTGRGEHGSPQR